MVEHSVWKAGARMNGGGGGGVVYNYVGAVF
jgi:galactokinase